MTAKAKTSSRLSHRGPADSARDISKAYRTVTDFAAAPGSVSVSVAQESQPPRAVEQLLAGFRGEIANCQTTIQILEDSAARLLGLPGPEKDVEGRCCDGSDGADSELGELATQLQRLRATNVRLRDVALRLAKV